MSDKSVVLAIFGSEASADRAVVALKGSALVPADAIGVLVLDGDGELKVEKAGARSTGMGATIGAVLILLGPAVAAIGVPGGSLLGTLHHKGLGLDGNDRDRIVTELKGGKAAVGVLAPAGGRWRGFGEAGRSGRRARDPCRVRRGSAASPVGGPVQLTGWWPGPGDRQRTSPDRGLEVGLRGLVQGFAGRTERSRDSHDHMGAG